MKLTAAVAAVLLTGSSGIWEKLPMHWKALGLILTLLGVGFSGGITMAGQLKIPARVTVLEGQQIMNGAQHDSLFASLAQVMESNELDRCLLKRVICRLDGESANSCDLQYAVRRSACTD